MKIVILRGGPCQRSPRPGATTRDSAVLAVGVGDGPWALLNISSAVAHQIDGDARWDGEDARTLVLTDAHLDNVGGLLALRDGPPIDLYATPAVFEELTSALPVLPVLQRHCGVHWHVIPVAGDQRVATFRVEALPEIEFTAIAPDDALVGERIALAVTDLATGQRMFCAPGRERLGTLEADWMRGADCLLVDGIEPPELLDAMPARHKVLLAQGDAPEGGVGVERAYDGMLIEL